MWGRFWSPKSSAYEEYLPDASPFGGEASAEGTPFHTSSPNSDSRRRRSFDPDSVGPLAVFLRSQCQAESCGQGSGLAFNSRISPSPSRSGRRSRRSWSRSTNNSEQQQQEQQQQHLHGFGHSHHHHHHVGQSAARRLAFHDGDIVEAEEEEVGGRGGRGKEAEGGKRREEEEENATPATSTALVRGGGGTSTPHIHTTALQQAATTTTASKIGLGRGDKGRADTKTKEAAASSSRRVSEVTRRTSSRRVTQQSVSRTGIASKEVKESHSKEVEVRMSEANSSRRRTRVSSCCLLSQWRTVMYISFSSLLL